jgi:hypothetical protein
MLFLGHLPWDPLSFRADIYIQHARLLGHHPSHDVAKRPSFLWMSIAVLQETSRKTLCIQEDSIAWVSWVLVFRNTGKIIRSLVKAWNERVIW